MKKLICLISTKGKTTEQVSREAWEAYQKYNKVKTQPLKNKKQKTKIKNNKKPEL